MIRPATTSVPIHPLLRDRYSPRAFADKALRPEDVLGLFEAARWAPSCFNDQPWRFVYSLKSSAAFPRFVDALMPSNASWCDKAAMIGVALVNPNFRHNDAANDWADYDLGLAMSFLTLEAMHRGIGIHQLAGFYPEKAKSITQAPSAWQPKVMFAAGYFGEAESLNEELKKREQAPRERLPLAELHAADRWPE